MSQTLLERLAACVPAALPMHMPGQKRNPALSFKPFHKAYLMLMNIL